MINVQNRVVQSIKLSSNIYSLTNRITRGQVHNTIYSVTESLVNTGATSVHLIIYFRSNDIIYYGHFGF